jgi:uncharacterized membrane protein YfcA
MITGEGMSARKSTVAVAAISAWAGAIALAYIHADINMVFSLLLTAAALFTFSLMQAKEKPPAKEQAAAPTPETSVLPLVAAHEVGFQQGWRAREMALSMTAAGGWSSDIPTSSTDQI